MNCPGGAVHRGHNRRLNRSAVARSLWPYEDGGHHASAHEHAAGDPAGHVGAALRAARVGAADHAPLADPRLGDVLARGAGHELRAARPPGRVRRPQRHGQRAGDAPRPHRAGGDLCAVPCRAEAPRLLSDQVRHQHPGRHGAGRRPARQHRPAGRGFLPRPHHRQSRRCQEGDHGPAAARHDIGPRLAGGPDRRHRLPHGHGAQSRLAAIRPRPTDGDRAGHALLLQQRQQPSAVGHPEQGHGPERQRLCAGKAVRAARHRRRAVAGRPAGPLGRRLGPPPAAARHGEDRLSLAARRPVGGQADPAGGVDRGRAPGRRRHARELGERPALRPPVLGDAAPRRLHGGRQATASSSSSCPSSTSWR